MCVDRELYEPFITKLSVKQECVMSPLLFALFLTDMHDSWSGGINIKERFSCARCTLY